MTEHRERRSQGAKRVSLETLVEICGNEPGIPAFEAEAIDVSGRGMHVRTAYLPGVGAPLVCRLEEQGREIVVEGVVAWRQEGLRGGEFGIQFTALDSGSVDALREICGPPASAGATDSGEAVSETSSNEPGTRVRLHIDGLGSPMKARVRAGTTRQIQVGSNLEFLKVGRHLEIEDLELGEKRGARIDAVNVAVDPQTQIPQLVVVLRYDDIEESTPEPSVLDSELSVSPRLPVEPAHMPLPAARNEPQSEHALVDAELAEDSDPELDGPELRGRIGVMATQAGRAVQSTGSLLVRYGASASSSAGKLFRGAASKVLELRRERADATKPRRTTAAPKGSMLPFDRQRLRQQAAATAKPEADEASALSDVAKKRQAKKFAAGAASAALLLTVGVIALQKPAEPPGSRTAAPAGAVAVAGSGDVKAVDEQGNPAKAASALKATAGATAEKGGVTADVPLFGPTPMATMEPAPLGPAPPPDAPPGSGSFSREASEMEAAKATPAADDEAFAEDALAGQKPKTNPSDVEPWGRGKIHTPTVHRLRLDAPGNAVQGAITPTGFVVVLPGRKAMESGSAIAQRDKRIASVRTKNPSSGAQISFQFKNGVPGYRVRLRKDYVEFLISAPDSPDGASSADVKSSTSKKKSTQRSAPKKSDSKKSAGKSAKDTHG